MISRIVFIFCLCSTFWLNGQRLTSEQMQIVEDMSLPELHKKLPDMKGHLEEYALEIALSKVNPENKAELKMATTYWQRLIKLLTSEQKQDYDLALEYAEQLVAAQAQLYDKDDINYTSSLLSLAYINRKKGLFEKAASYYNEVATIRKFRDDELPHYEYAKAMDGLGALAFRQSDYDKALKHFRIAAQIILQTKGRENLYYATALNNLGSIYKIQGLYDKALEQFEKALAINRKRIEGPNREASTLLINIADIYKKQGNIKVARSMYEEALLQRKSDYGTRHSAYAQVLMKVADCMFETGNYGGAQFRYKKAEGIIGKTLGEQHPDYAIVLNNIAACLTKLELPEKALPYYVKVKRITEQTLGAKHGNYATLLSNMGNLYLQSGDTRSTRLSYERAYKIESETVGASHPRALTAALNLADFYFRVDNYEESAAIYQQVLKQITGLSWTLPLSAKAVAKLRKTDVVSVTYKQLLVEVLEGVFRWTGKAVSNNSTRLQMELTDLAMSVLQEMQQHTIVDKDKLFILSKQNNWLKKHLNLLSNPNDFEQGFILAEKNKAVLLLAATRSNEVSRSRLISKETYEAEQALINKTKALESALLQTPKRFQALDALNKHYQELAVFNKALEQNNPAYVAFKSQGEIVKLSDIQAKLSAEEALIEYVLSDTMMHVFFCTSTAQQWISIPIEGAMVEQKVKQLITVLGDYKLLLDSTAVSYERFGQLAHWNYKTLLAPVLKALPATKKLIIIPDGILGNLPFECLLRKPYQAAEAPAYLLRDYTLSYSYSASLWYQLRAKAHGQNNGRMLAMVPAYGKEAIASPVYRSEKEKELRTHLRKLSGADVEVGALKSNIHGDFIYGQEANEQVLKSKMGDYSVLHFAAHGLLHERQPDLSSLILSETADSAENNFWHAYEIANTKLNADLVVLSACETGNGTFEQGNGIASLGRAFMYAGVSSVVVSLWKVNDYSTAYLMKHFYNNMSKGMAKDEALRNAKLSYLDKADGLVKKHPALWSAFVQQGNVQAVVLERKASAWIWWVMAIGFVVLTGGIMYRKAKNK